MALALLLTGFGSGKAAAHGDLHDQIADVTRQIARRPDDARLYVKRGELHRFHGELTDALSDYDRAARLDPALAEVDLGRGKTLFEAGRPADARAALERFLERRPDHADARLSLARVFVRLRLPAQADAEFARAIRLVGRPKPDLYFERATALASAARLDAAIRVIDEGIARLGALAAAGPRSPAVSRTAGCCWTCAPSATTCSTSSPPGCWSRAERSRLRAVLAHIGQRAGASLRRRSQT